MKYLIEQTNWDNGYYRLIDSATFESSKECENSYCKNGSYFTITKLDDEIQTTTRRTRGSKSQQSKD